MKKIVSLILAVLLVATSSIAFAADYSSMSEEQLKTEYNAIRNELISRGLKAENKRVLVDKDGVQIYINGDITVDKQYAWDENYTLFVPIVIINNTSHNINMLVENPSVNGWSVDSGYSSLTVPANKKSKASFAFSLKDSDVESIKDFEDVEFSLRVYDDNTWKDLFTTKAISIVAE